MRAVLVLLALVAVPRGVRGEEAPAYFPLEVGNWWAYEELDDEGRALSRETWSVLEDARGGEEFHVRALAKRLDELGRTGSRRFIGHEYLRRTAAGIHKRYPEGRDAAVEVMLLKEPLRSGTRWRDAQGECEVKSRGTCTGPRGELPDCAVVVCRLGDPTSTVVTSTYARDVGMVRQEIDVVQFLPSLNSGAVIVPCDGTKAGHSLLRLTAFHVAPR